MFDEDEPSVAFAVADSAKSGDSLLQSCGSQIWISRASRESKKYGKLRKYVWIYSVFVVR